MWWGFSKALDLLDENSDSEKDEERILLVGQSDCRHVLKTLARKYQHKEVNNVKLYVVEPLMENVARDLLFLTLALEPPEHVGIAEKTLFFMELYGNTLLRPTTANYLQKLSRRLLNVITNVNFGQQILPSVCLEKLKYKERDQLEVIFKYWAVNNNSFDILTAWDERLRKHLGVRYDSRTGVYDWDYHMRYHCFGADVLQFQEYKRFREKGIAFYFDDTNPCVSNSTLASAIFPAGSKILSYGYLGDIITGPYTTFGLDCEDKDMFKKTNGRILKSATNFSERNLMRIFHEIEHQTPFTPTAEEDGYCGIYKDDSNQLKIHENPTAESIIRLKDECTVYQSLSTNNCQVIFLPTSALQNFPTKPEYENFFDKAFIAQVMVFKHIKPDFFKMLKPRGKVIVDTPKYLLNYRKEDLEKFKNDIDVLMSESQCKLASPYDHEKDEFVRYTVEKVPEADHFAKMSTILEKIAAIEAEMARTQKNKATAGHLGLLKARLAKLRRELITPKGGGGGPGEGFDVAKTGDARIGFVGFPSVGKSTLLSNLAGVYSEVAAYEFTTLTTVPGCIKYKGAKIQLLDLPGIIEGAKDGKGRGRQVIAVARTCSLIFIVLDVLKPLQHKKLIEHELEGFGLRLNKEPPNIVYRKKDKGGVSLQCMVPQSELDIDTVKSILSEYKIHNADITLRYDATSDDLIDVIEGNRIYVPCIYILNKIDQISIEELDIIYKIPHTVPISAHHKWNFDDLLEKMWEYLKLIRIYTKPKGQLPDYSSPVVLHSDKRSVEDFCNKLHKIIAKEFKYALVWGSSVKHQPQKVGKDHVLNDEDVVQIVKKV